ncbi:MAG: hypothetical protein HZA50_11600 [Planctomycetes bacterium]|nr:hypothetical protein [Planctomycetota bacterium]
MSAIAGATINITANDAGLQQALAAARSGMIGIQAAASQTASSAANMIPAAPLAEAEGGVLRVKRGTDILAGAFGMAGANARILGTAFNLAEQTSGGFTASLKSMALGVKSLIVGLGPVGWTIMAVVAAFMLFQHIAESAQKKMEDLAKANDEYAKSAKEAAEITNAIKTKNLELTGDKKGAELAELKTDEKKKLEELEASYRKQREIINASEGDDKSVEAENRKRIGLQRAAEGFLKDRAGILENGRLSERNINEKYDREEASAAWEKYKENAKVENEIRAASAQGVDKEIAERRAKFDSEHMELETRLAEEKITREQFDRLTIANLGNFERDKEKIRREAAEKEEAELQKRIDMAMEAGEPERKRLESISEIIDKLREEDAALKLTGDALAIHRLGLWDANEGQKAYALEVQKSIDAQKQAQDEEKSFADQMAGLQDRIAAKIAENSGDEAAIREAQIEHLMNVNKFTREHAETIVDEQNKLKKLGEAQKQARGEFSGLAELWRKTQEGLINAESVMGGFNSKMPPAAAGAMSPEGDQTTQAVEKGNDIQQQQLAKLTELVDATKDSSAVAVMTD